MPEECQDFLHNCLLFDIEVNEHDTVYSVGAVFRGERFQIKPGKRVGMHQLRELDIFGADASYILGHNILDHDIPRLKQTAPSLDILHKPAIDTLYLSPLAYPENPYHRLVKDYQLVRDSVNDPAEDAQLAGRVFCEQWSAFTEKRVIGEGDEILILYRSFLQRDAALNGTAGALGAMGIGVVDNEHLYEAFSGVAVQYGCRTATRNIVDQLIKATFSGMPLAYVTAWLTVAGGNSVLPPWVRHRFPEVVTFLHQLRESPCEDPGCDYCRRHHNPKYYLQNFFGFDDFRAKPVSDDGTSLQDAIVQASARNTTLFATLPTGGGKSLCYLLPALMRYQRRNMLTIIISPLQALMKDQVDNFSKQTGTKIAAPLYGMLTMVERGQVLEGIRSGDIGILYVSPEQLRNHSFIKTVSQREIGAWVFDEAHCLSKWGHDFRPDYLYSIRFIRELATREKTRIPPLQCFTATAKKDVKAEITDIIQSELGLKVSHFSGGHERTNLHYEVWPVERYEKYQTILELLRARFGPVGGSVVIYCGSRKATEKMAEYLQREGYTAEAFHAGLDPSLKKRIQENFIEGLTPIICATNAFGMGIDKPNVRFVAHLDMPKSIEAYYQETGRAGRDGESSTAILFYGMEDVVKLTQMLGNSEGNEQHKIHERQRLNAMLGLCEMIDCRRQALLRYFGEILETPCGNCDNCIHPPETWDATDAVRKALSCVYRTGQRFGAAHVIDVLRGSTNEKVRQFSHTELSTYGIGKELSAEAWRTIFRQLVVLGHLDVDVRGYGNLLLTDKCRPILRGEANIELPQDIKTKPERPSGKSGGASKRTQYDIAEEDQGLWNALRSCRKQLADEANVPPYVVFGDAALKEMVVKRPMNDEEFLCVNGVGDKKLEKYGEIFLEIIHDHEYQM